MNIHVIKNSKCNILRNIDVIKEHNVAFNLLFPISFLLGRGLIYIFSKVAKVAILEARTR